MQLGPILFNFFLFFGFIQFFGFTSETKHLAAISVM